MRAPKGIDGISVVPTLLGQADRQRRHDYLFWIYSGTRTVRMGDWKAIGWPPRFKLYNLTDDIGETTDLFKQHPDVVARIRKIMIEAYTKP